MKKPIFIVCMSTLLLITLIGCVSTSEVSKSPKEIQYNKLEYVSKRAIEDVTNDSTGFIYENVFITKNNNLVILSDGFRDLDLNVSEFLLTNPDFEKMLEKDRKYTVYVKVERAGDFLSGYTNKAVLTKVEGLRTNEEIEAEKVAVATAKSEKEASDAKAKAEREIVIDTKAKSFAVGYVYHGVSEDVQNGKLFNSGALEAGHAYYVSGYMVGSGGIIGGVIISAFSDPIYHSIDYASQKVKGAVVGASQTAFGTLPVAVVIAGGKPPFRTPVILGLVD